MLIVDAGIKPMSHDKEMAEILRKEGLDFVVLANKIDRLNQSEKLQNLKAIEAELAAPVLPYSARIHSFRLELLDVIENACT